MARAVVPQAAALTLRTTHSEAVSHTTSTAAPRQAALLVAARLPLTQRRQPAFLPLAVLVVVPLQAAQRLARALMVRSLAVVAVVAQADPTALLALLVAPVLAANAL